MDPALTSHSLGVAIEDFLDHLRVERTASVHTVSAYRNDLEAAATFLAEQGLTSWAQLRNAQLAAYENSLANRLAPGSIRRRLSSLRSFLKFLKREGISLEAELPSVVSFRRSKILPKSLDLATVDRLVEVAPTQSAGGLRDRALYELIFGAGLRISEAVELELSALDLPGYSVRIFGKRGKTRINPLPEITASWLRMYLETSRPRLLKSPSKFLIVSDRGKPLLRQTAYKILQRHVKEAGIVQEVSPHTLRHSFAVEMLKGGADLRVVQELLGHESIATTQIYTELDLEEVKKRYRQAHPRR